MPRLKNLPFISLLCVMLLSSSMIGTVAQASVIGTSSVIAAQSRQAQLETVRSALDRQEVRERLSALGVERNDLDARISALTDAELANLATSIDSQPAGGILAVLGIVFIVLLVLEYTGAIDIFKKVP
jgi:hypothetical protein